jgi:hypothetical protein
MIQKCKVFFNGLGNRLSYLHGKGDKPLDVKICYLIADGFDKLLGIAI